MLTSRNNNAQANDRGVSMSTVVPFYLEQETLICGKCQNQDGLFYIGTDFVAFCSECTWTVLLETSKYPDLRENNEKCNE